MATNATVAVSPDRYFGSDGDTITLTRVMTGLDPAEVTESYQWTHNGTDIVGATNEDYVISVTGSPDAGDYAVKVVIDNNGDKSTITSPNVSIMYVDHPTLSVSITPNPFHEWQGISVDAGSDLNMPISYEYYKYEWWVDGVHDAANDSEGTEPKTLHVANPDANKSYVLKAVVDTKESNGKPVTFESAAVKPTFKSVADITHSGITADKESAYKGDSVTITAVFDQFPSGVSELSRTWQKDGVTIPGATNGAYTFTVNDASSVGDFKAVAKVGIDATKSIDVESPVQTIAFIKTPVIAITADDNTPEIGDTVHFTSTVTGAETGHTPQSYQWYKDGAALSGKTSATLDVVAATATLGKYTLKVKVGVDSATAREFTSNEITVSEQVDLVAKWTVHPIPWRDTSFTPIGYWVLDEILYQKDLGKDWKTDYADYKYSAEVQTLLKAFNENGECEVQDSRNGYIHKMSEI